MSRVRHRHLATADPILVAVAQLVALLLADLDVEPGRVWSCRQHEELQGGWGKTGRRGGFCWAGAKWDRVGNHDDNSGHLSWCGRHASSQKRDEKGDEWNYRVHRSDILGRMPPNGSRLSCGRKASKRTARCSVAKNQIAHKWNSTLLGRARQLQALVRRRRPPWS